MKRIYKTCEVTQEHINNGSPGDASCCAISLALMEREIGEKDKDTDLKVSTNNGDIYFYTIEKDSQDGYDINMQYRIRMDNWDIVNQFINDYDRGDEGEFLGKDDVEPFEFKYFIGD